MDANDLENACQTTAPTQSMRDATDERFTENDLPALFCRQEISISYCGISFLIAVQL